MKPDDIKAWVDIVNAMVATLAIIAAGLWFLLNRSLAGTLQITINLTSVTMVNNTRIAIIRVYIKNVGRTRIKKDYCAAAAKILKVRSNSKPITIIEAEPLNYALGKEIFRSLVEIEPNEELYQDIAFALNKSTFFAVGVRLKRKMTKAAWQAIAVFNADDKAKGSSLSDLLAEQAATSG